jgi:hypothetical protein
MNTPSFVDGYHDEIQSFQLWLWLLLLMWFNWARRQILMVKNQQNCPYSLTLFFDAVGRCCWYCSDLFWKSPTWASKWGWFQLLDFNIDKMTKEMVGAVSGLWKRSWSWLFCACTIHVFRGTNSFAENQDKKDCYLNCFPCTNPE